MKTKIIAEIGINFAYGTDPNQFMTNVKKLIDAAAVAGADYVKFQKRDPYVCVPEAERLKAKRVPWRKEETTYMQYKLDIELNWEQYKEIDQYCEAKGITWFASVWDKNSVDFMRKFEVMLPTGKWGVMTKIPSALIHDLELIEYARDNSDFLLISTGMSTQAEIDLAIEVGQPDVVFHTNSTYPSPIVGTFTATIKPPCALRVDLFTCLQRFLQEPPSVVYPQSSRLGLNPPFVWRRR